jgi:hypothetical protein
MMGEMADYYEDTLFFDECQRCGNMMIDCICQKACELCNKYIGWGCLCFTVYDEEEVTQK